MKRNLRRVGWVWWVVCTLLLATSLYAQDAAMVLQRSVGYGTLKNSATLTPEKRAEVEAIEVQTRAASAAGRYGEALKYMAKATAAIRGQEFTPLRALDAALVCKVDRAVLEPGQTFEVRLSQYFALDEKPSAKLSATVVMISVPTEEGARAVETPVKTVADLTPDWNATPQAIKLTVPQLPDGGYRLAVTLTSSADGEKDPPVRKFVALRLGSGLAASVQAAKARVTQVRGKLSAKAALLAELPTSEYRLQLFDLANAGEVDPTRLDFTQELKDVAAALDALDAGRSSLAARRGDFRRAYLSKVDNTLQPYRAYIPNSYDGSKDFPLVIALHGMGGNENSYFDGYRGSFKVEAEKRGYLVACPKGRLPASMYTGTAEQDVLDVIAEMRQAYKVDPQRIYLTGHSMGGYGTWSLAMNHPEMFAALGPIAGGGNPTGMAKIAHIPQIVIHGDNDKTVPVERSRVMVEAGKKAGAKIKYVEVPGGSHVSIATPAFPDIFDWFDSHTRPAAQAVSAGSKN